MALPFAGQRQIFTPNIDRLIAGPDALPSRWALVRLILAAQLIGGASGTIYLLLLWRTTGQPWAGFPALPLLGLGAVMLAATFAWSRYATRALARIEGALASGVDVRELDLADVRDALIHHRSLSWGMGIQWALCAVCLTIGAQLLGIWSAGMLPHAISLGLTFPVYMAVIVRYIGLAWHGLDLTAVLLPDGRLDHLGPMPMERVFRHLLTLFALLGVVMPLALVIIARADHSTNGLMAHLVLDFLVVGGFVMHGVMRSIALPAGYLESRMAEVGTGDLQVQARIFSADTFGSLSTHFNRMVEGLKQREQIRDIFGRYVTQQVAEEILSGRVALGGERRTATVLFADIRGFTALSERLDPEEVVALLNEVLGAMVRCVLDEGGVLDKFIGDAVMALFGVPLSAGDPRADAEAALRCALGMSRVLDDINAERARAGHEVVEMGIGVHTGEVVAGNIGIPERMEYTVIGDAVNLSSRLEGLTKTFHRRILVSEATAALLDDFGLDVVDTVQVRGRIEPVTIYAPAA